jgi:hypothetical protein
MKLLTDKQANTEKENYLLPSKHGQSGRIIWTLQPSSAGHVLELSA